MAVVQIDTGRLPEELASKAVTKITHRFQDSGPRPQLVVLTPSSHLNSRGELESYTVVCPGNVPAKDVITDHDLCGVISVYKVVPKGPIDDLQIMNVIKNLHRDGLIIDESAIDKKYGSKVPMVGKLGCSITICKYLIPGTTFESMYAIVIKNYYPPNAKALYDFIHHSETPPTVSDLLSDVAKSPYYGALRQSVENNNAIAGIICSKLNFDSVRSIPREENSLKEDFYLSEQFDLNFGTFSLQPYTTQYYNVLDTKIDPSTGNAVFVYYSKCVNPDKLENGYLLGLGYSKGWTWYNYHIHGPMQLKLDSNSKRFHGLPLGPAPSHTHFTVDKYSGVEYPPQTNPTRLVWANELIKHVKFWDSYDPHKDEIFFEDLTLLGVPAITKQVHLVPIITYMSSMDENEMGIEEIIACSRIDSHAKTEDGENNIKVIKVILTNPWCEEKMIKQFNVYKHTNPDTKLTGDFIIFSDVNYVYLDFDILGSVVKVHS